MVVCLGVLFGTDAHITAVAWINLTMHEILRTLCKLHILHLLWGFFIIRTYATKLLISAQVGGIDLKRFEIVHGSMLRIY